LIISALLGPPRVPPSRYQSNRLRYFSSYVEPERAFPVFDIRSGFLCKSSGSLWESCGIRIKEMFSGVLRVLHIPSILRCYNDSRDANSVAGGLMSFHHASVMELCSGGLVTNRCQPALSFVIALAENAQAYFSGNSSFDLATLIIII
jgi:hypothetical protein